MTHLITQYGLALIFANVLLEQVGLPIPAIPTLIVAGALAVQGELSAWAIFGAAFLACMIGDLVWYLAGRRYGRRVMALLCRMSLSPDSCVRQTEVRFERWGGLTLVLSKFIPGLSTIAPPLAGAMRLGWPSFLLLNGLGVAIWAGSAIAAGMLLHSGINDLMLRLEGLGTLAIEAIGALLAAYVAAKWWERRRFYKMLRIARIGVEELRALIEQGKRPVVVDVRSQSSRELDRRFIPGALTMTLDDVEQRLEELPADREVVFYCTCPNEASAAQVAKKLIGLGYTKVRPLHGGLDAWIAAGYEIEERAGT
ncbi:MAG TPA: DedA family protein/thiosulfate sulfurtransferase GlpE [Burkholderiales bacterium]|nr:DedA family protein/thiosulfate sulfurtransferase GlpE [Burkholderiales bacterium]